MTSCPFKPAGVLICTGRKKKKTPVGTDLHISRIVRHVGFSLNISLLNCNNYH